MTSNISIVGGAMPMPEPIQETPVDSLITAIQKGDEDGAKHVLSSGAISKKTIDDITLLHYACEWGNLAIVRSLIDYGADIEKKSNSWLSTPLHRAVFFGRPLVAQELIRRGATVNTSSQPLDEYPLASAISSPHLDCCSLIRTSGGQTFSLPMACSGGNADIVGLFLEYGVDPNEPDTSQRTPLCLAVHFPKILELLLDRGAQIHGRNCTSPFRGGGNQPLHEAIAFGLEGSVRFLLEKGASPQEHNSQGETALAMAQKLLALYEVDTRHSADSALIARSFREIIDLLEKAGKLLSKAHQ